jgi:hypothetical protein
MEVPTDWRARRRRAKGLQESFDLYDLVSEYLVSEGFCDSYEDADVIMANMSEEWREGIILEYGAFGGRVSRSGYGGTSERERKEQEKAKKRHELRSRAQRVVRNQRRGSHGKADSTVENQPDNKRDYNPNSGWAHYLDHMASKYD